MPRYSEELPILGGELPDAPKGMKGKQKLFAYHYARIGYSSYHNGAESARLAGYSQKRAARTAVSLLQDSKVRQYIATIEKHLARELNLNKDSYIAKLKQELEKTDNPHARIRLWELIGKAQGHLKPDTQVNTAIFQGLNKAEKDKLEGRLRAIEGENTQKEGQNSQNQGNSAVISPSPS